MVAEPVGLFMGWKSLWLLFLLCRKRIWVSAYLYGSQLYSADSVGNLEYSGLDSTEMVWNRGYWTCVDFALCKTIFCRHVGSDFVLFL